MNKLSILFLFFTFTIFGQSNRFHISGKIVSEDDKNPLESATIHLERMKDSSVISYTISTEDGEFDLSGKTFYKDIRMVVSYIGMKRYERKIPFNQLKDYTTGTIELENENTLNEVVISASAPITIKKDTLEFNVKSFKTKKNANVEDLLKKLPGVEVDSEGKITVNGKPVNNILVNGKPFFGNDQSIATKNLSKDIIEKIQVTDTKTKSEGFTGEKGDKNNKTINLTIKKENNKGWFGRIAGGAGTEKHYEGALMVNRFLDKRQISVLVGGNNINSPGFSFGEIRKMFGGMSSYSNNNGGYSIAGINFGIGEGIVTSKNIGATYNDELKKGIDLNLSYFSSGSSSENTSKKNREYTLTDNHYFTESAVVSNSESYNHNFKMGFDIEIDPTVLINLKPEFSYSKQNGLNKTNQKSLNTVNELTNEYSSKSMRETTTKNFNNRIDITKKIDTLGSFVKVVIENRFNQNDSEDFNNSTIEVFGINASLEDRNQKSKGTKELSTFKSAFTYRYPILPKKYFIDVKYTYNLQNQKNQKHTYDFDLLAKDFTEFNSLLSSNYKFENVTKTPFLEATYKGKKLNFDIGAGYDMKTLKNEDFLRPNYNILRDFNNFTFRSGLDYKFKSGINLYSQYNTGIITPQLHQLQSFTDVSNPSNIRVGNPNLKPSRGHYCYFSLNKFNWKKLTGVYISANASYIKDAIVNNTTIEDNLIRKTSYENLGEKHDIWGSARYNFGFKLDSINKLKIRVGVFVINSSDLSVFNKIINKTSTNSISPKMGLEYIWNKKINIEPSYQINFENRKYSVNRNQNRKFTIHSLRVKTKTNIPKKLEWENDIRYNYNPNLIGFEKSSLFWNATFSYSVLKDKGAITLKAYDLLNQNTNAKRSASQNYIEDQESTVLQRYLMLGFSWKFNTMGAKGKSDGDIIFF